MKIQSSNLGRTFRTIFVQKCSPHVLQKEELLTKIYLYRPPCTSDIDEYTEVQRVLREEIVNPLRKNWFVRADRVMKLRQLLDSLTSVRGLMSEEKGK